MGKPGRPPGRKTWHKTRGVEIAEAFQTSRLFGLLIRESMDEIGEFFHVEQETVLRSFYRHKTEAELNVDDDPLTHLWLLMSEIICEIMSEMPTRIVQAIDGISDVQLVKSVMLNELIQIPEEFRRRTRNLSSDPETQEVIDDMANAFYEGWFSKRDISSPG